MAGINGLTGDGPLSRTYSDLLLILDKLSEQDRAAAVNQLERLMETRSTGESDQQRLLIAQEAGELGLWEWDQQNARIIGSPKIFEIFGSSYREEVTLEEALARFLDKDAAIQVEQMLQTAAQGDDFWCEVRIQHPQRGIRWIEMFARPVFSPEGQLVRINGSSRDITERKQAAAFNDAVNEINQIIHSTHNMDEVMQSAVTAAAQALGCDTAALSQRKGQDWIISHVYGFPEEVIGSRMDDQEELHAVLAIQSKQPVAISDAYNDERVNREHLRKWCIRSVLVVPLLVRSETIGVIFFNYMGAITEFTEAHIGFATRLATSISLALENARLFQDLEQEIAERKQTGAALLESETRFRIALENSKITVFSQDKDLRYQWIFNPSFALKPEEFLGKHDEEIFPADVAAQLKAIKQSVLLTGRGVHSEISIPLPGRVLYFLVTFEPSFDQQGQVNGLRGSAVEVTEQRELELKQREQITQMEVQRRLLEHRERERQEIARDIHDGPIQTLVSAIFNIHVIKETIKDPLAQMEFEQVAHSLKSAVRELRDLLNELRPPSLIHFGLPRMLQVHAIDFQERHPEIELTLNLIDDQTQLPEAVSLVLYRINQESLNNIARHSGAKRARVLLAERPDEVILEIQDNGRGFYVPADLSSITQQGHFGLAGMKERVHTLGGTLEILSTPGEGTTIRAVIPLASREQAAG